MFVELAEFLRCPRDDSEAFCVVVSDEVVDRSIVSGMIGCPATKREYRIERGVVDFVAGDTVLPMPEDVPAAADAQAVCALLGITEAGGYVVLLGSAAGMSGQLSALIGGVHFVGLNPPHGVGPTPTLSLLTGPHPLPLRSSMARGVVVGSEYASEPWLSDVNRILLNGMRAVVFREGVSISGISQLGVGDGIWVGRKTG